MPNRDADATEPERAELFRAIGSAITAWVEVENELAAIFAACLGPSYYLAPDERGMTSVDVGMRTVMETVDNFRTRLLLIDAAMTTVMAGLGERGDELLASWTIERRKLSGPAGNRNKLAHWNVVGTIDGLRLVPPRFRSDLNEYMSRKSPGFAVYDINAWEDSFYMCAGRLRRLLSALASFPELHQKLLQPAASLLRQIGRHDPVERERLDLALGLREWEARPPMTNV